MSTSSRSPAPWPRLSLTTLKWSRSQNRTATPAPVRRPRARAMRRRSRSRVRLGRPVSGSWVACSAAGSRSRFRSLMSRATIESQPTSPSAPRWARHCTADRDLEAVAQERQLAGPDAVDLQARRTSRWNRASTHGGQAGLDVLGGDLDVDQVVEVQGRPVQVERGAVGVGDHDEVAGGLDDPGEPVVVGDHVPVAVFGVAGLGDVDGVDREAGVLGVVEAVLEVHAGPAPAAVGRAQADLDLVGGAGMGHQRVPPGDQLVVEVDAPVEAAQDRGVVALDVGVAEEAEEPGVDVDQAEVGVDAGDLRPGVARPEQVGVGHRPGAVLRGVTQDHATRTVVT